jgi:gliding motility-associated-like protein
MSTNRRFLFFRKRGEGGKLKIHLVPFFIMLSFFKLSAHIPNESSEIPHRIEKNNNKLTGFTFNCTAPTITGNFYASGIAQSGFVTLRINNVTAGATSIVVTNTKGFSGGLASTTLLATQTTIQIPISFIGTSSTGTYTLVISSPDATNTCNVTIPVVSCSTYKPAISTNVPSILCIGDSVEMTASSGTQYAWSSGETTASIVKKIVGTYNVTVTSNGCTGANSQKVSLNTNCVAGLCSGSLSPNSYNITFGKGTRSNLESAVAGAVTTHIYAPTGMFFDGRYAILNNASVAGPWAVSVGDHSGDGPTGRIMVINADNTPKECFRFPVNGLSSNLKYQFSAWVKNLNGLPEKPNLTLEVREAQTDTLLAITGTGNIPYGDWIQYGMTFITPPTNPNLIVVIRNNTIGGTNGNDLAIDDIQFAYCGPPVNVTMQGGIFDAFSGEGSACAGKSLVLKPTIAAGYINVPVYQWQESLDNGLTWRDILGATTLNYTFISNSALTGRKFKVLVAETDKLSNPASRVESNIITFKHLTYVGTINAQGPINLCAGDSVALTASKGLSYSWNTGENTATIIKKSTGSYTVTITNAGDCLSTASMDITFNPKPITTITGESNIKLGETSILTASSDVGSTYLWSTGERAAEITVNKVGTYTVTVTNSNGCMSTTSKTISLIVNRPPTLTNATPSVLEDDVVMGSVYPNASDADNNLNLNSFKVLDSPVNGIFQMLPNGDFTYTPKPDFNGVDSVHYQVCDLSGACVKATIIITILPVNDPPKAKISIPTVNEDTPINVCGVITDKDLGDGFNTLSCNLPKGSFNASINGNQLCINYTPFKDYNGVDTICLLVCDKGGLCDTLKIPINIVAVNDPPSLVVAPITVPVDSTFFQCFPITDPDAQDGHSVTQCNTARGTAQVKIDNGNVCLTYSTKTPNFDKDTVCVTLCDRAGACTKILIPLTITPCADNTPPTINCPSPIEISTVGTILNDPSGFIRLAMLADNCNGVNLDFKLPTAIDDCSSTPIVRQTGGLLSGGTFAKGSNILSFEALDKTGKKSTCRVEITVSPIQLLETDKATACLNETVHIQGKLIPKAAYAWKGPQNLTSDNPSLDFTFTNTNQSGPYILSATLGKNCVFKDTITITVNNAPKVVNDSFAVEINGTLTENVLKNDSVKNGIIYTLTTRDNAVNGSVILKNDGTITYKPTTDYTGVDKFTYEVCSELCPNICQKGTVVLTVASPFKQVYSANEVITPNGDNFNEALIIEGLNVHNPKNNSSIAIYSQWGELVYTAAPYMNNWKGTHKDLPLPDGTYYYIFKADPKSEALKSFITIFR